ncbi:hypothetical protein JCM4914_04980 [Streptomyces platensis subsp. malvinus]
MDRHAHGLILVESNAELQAAAVAHSRVAARDESFELLFPDAEIALGKEELKACVEEVGGYQDIGAQGVMTGQNAGLMTSGDTNDAAVAARVCQVDQLDWFRLSHGAPPHGPSWCESRASSPMGREGNRATPDDRSLCIAIRSR